MSDKDVDAQFADIVAHWDEVAVPPQERLDPYAAGSPAQEPSPDTPPVSDPPASGSPLDDLADGPPDAADRADRVDRVDPVDRPRELGRGVNPPPDLGFVVWRGATEPVAGPPQPQADDDGDDDHFHPLPTAPLPPQEDLHFWGIIVGLVAGPLLLLWLVIFRPAVSGWWTVGALGLTIGGFVLLVLRQPAHRDGDDPDDGARI
jgi:hypothetical protein